jgi:hypothetical protein
LKFISSLSELPVDAVDEHAQDPPSVVGGSMVSGQ